MDVNSTYLFTYGTLMQGFDNPFANRLHQHADFMGNGYFQGSLFLISWYPGALYEPDSTSKVYGEIYRLTAPESIIGELDEYEDVFEDEKSSLYLRKMVSVTPETGAVLECWAYLYNQSVAGATLIPDGRFRRSD